MAPKWSGTAEIVELKGELVIKITLRTRRQNTIIGRVDESGRVNYSAPESVPRKIKENVTRRLANEIIHRRLTET